jgi:hypothetical protein
MAFLAGNVPQPLASRRRARLERVTLAPRHLPE